MPNGISQYIAESIFPYNLTYLYFYHIIVQKHLQSLVLCPVCYTLECSNILNFLRICASMQAPVKSLLLTNSKMIGYVKICLLNLANNRTFLLWTWREYSYLRRKDRLELGLPYLQLINDMLVLLNNSLAPGLLWINPTNIRFPSARLAELITFNNPDLNRCRSHDTFNLESRRQEASCFYSTPGSAYSSQNVCPRL